MNNFDRCGTSATDNKRLLKTFLIDIYLEI